MMWVSRNFVRAVQKNKETYDKNVKTLNDEIDDRDKTIIALEKALADKDTQWSKCSVGGCEASKAMKPVCEEHWCSETCNALVLRPGATCIKHDRDCLCGTVNCNNSKQLATPNSAKHCTAHTCSVDGCVSEVQKGRHRCATHIFCEVPLCQQERRFPSGLYCDKHSQCAIDGCGYFVPAVSNARHCVFHQCMQKDCQRAVTETGFCDDHRCKLEGCRQGRGHKPYGPILKDSEWCALHTCQWDFQTSRGPCLKGNEGLCYCTGHRCIMEGCDRHKKICQSKTLEPKRPEHCKDHSTLVKSNSVGAKAAAERRKRPISADSGYRTEEGVENQGIPQRPQKSEEQPRYEPPHFEQPPYEQPHYQQPPYERPHYEQSRYPQYHGDAHDKRGEYNDIYIERQRHNDDAYRGQR